MSQYVKATPLGNSRGGKSFVQWAQEKSRKWLVSKEELMLKELEMVMSEIIKNSSRWTGASSGEKGSRKVYPSHPAAGMTIGNYFNGGESGWQMGKKKINQYSTQFYIYNPMWQPYLRFVEKGMVPGAQGRDVVRTAWLNSKARRHG